MEEGRGHHRGGGFKINLAAIFCQGYYKRQGYKRALLLRGISLLLLLLLFGGEAATVAWPRKGRRGELSGVISPRLLFGKCQLDEKKNSTPKTVKKEREGFS